MNFINRAVTGERPKPMKAKGETLESCQHCNSNNIDLQEEILSWDNNANFEVCGIWHCNGCNDNSMQTRKYEIKLLSDESEFL